MANGLAVKFWRRYRFLVIAAVFLLGALTLFSLSAGRSPKDTFLSPYLMEVFGPVQSAVTNAAEWTSGLWRDYFALVHTARQNRELKAQVDAMRAKLVHQEELAQANQRLRALLGLKQEHQFPALAAEVVASDTTKYFRIAILNKGSNEGVEVNMPVIHAQGVVGRVIWVSPNFCKVLLLTDPNSGCDVLVQRSRTSGVVTGLGEDRLALKYVQYNHDVTPGDRVVTTGVAGIYPRGVLVGVVTSVEERGKGAFLKVELAPAVDFSRLEEALIIMRPQRTIE